MAKDYIGLSGYEVFPLDINWKSGPTLTRNTSLTKTLLSFPGTSESLIPVISQLPTEMGVMVSIYSKGSEKVLFDFFDSHKGRWKKFWIKNPANTFKLYDSAEVGALYINIEANGFQAIYTGVERFCLEDRSGNSVIRRITSVELSEAETFITLRFDDELVDTWNKGDLSLKMGIIKLVRFNKDDLKVIYKTDMNFDITLKLKELPYEYSEV